MPLLMKRIYSSAWLEREVGVLALGAIAEGAFHGVAPHLPKLFPHLIKCLNDDKSLVRCIACWTLGRYVRWCLDDDSEEHVKTYLEPLINGLLRAALDPNQRVQEAGCSAFATLEEECGLHIAPFVGTIIQGLGKAFTQYRSKNLLNLYDAVSTLAESAGSELNRTEYLEVLLPPLMSKYSSLANDDPDLIPILECLLPVASAMGEGLGAYAPAMFQRSVTMVAEIMAQYQASEEFDWRMPSKFVICALDLLSGLIQGLQLRSRPLVHAMSMQLIPLLVFCFRVPERSVRQSAYALLGDLTISTLPQLRPSIPHFLPLLVDQLVVSSDPDDHSVINNAAWALGEVALQLGSDPVLRTHLDDLVTRLIALLQSDQTSKALAENAAVTLGRLGLVVAEDVAPRLETFAESWCQALWDTKDNSEKDSAYRGFGKMVLLNPKALEQSFGFWCLGVVHWVEPSQELNDDFVRILIQFRILLGPKWEEQLAQLPSEIAERLHNRYGL